MPKKRQTLDELKMRGDFVRRHIGPGDDQIAGMLDAIGLSSVDELVKKTVPDSILDETPLALEPAKSERDE